MRYLVYRQGYMKYGGWDRNGNPIWNANLIPLGHVEARSGEEAIALGRTKFNVQFPIVEEV